MTLMADLNRMAHRIVQHECWSRSYPPDVFPGLWVRLDELITQQQVLCPDEVRVELASRRPRGRMSLDEAE
jgi:hypothetical protein